ncbi:MAG: hypothetical protein LBH53_00875 [Puniceicoccales bacterium]|nr:hypothetical protein [Puniceicoccales bacterium]
MLKSFGIATAIPIIGGPIGICVSLLLYILFCTITACYLYASFNNSELTWKSGYSIREEEIPPPCNETVLPQNRDVHWAVHASDISRCANLCGLDDNKQGGQNPGANSWRAAGAEECEGSLHLPKFKELMQEYGKMNLCGPRRFRTDRGDIMWVFFRQDLAMEIHVAIDANGRLFFRTHVNEDTPEGRSVVVNNVIGKCIDRQASLFEYAYVALTFTLGKTYGCPVLTGNGQGASYAQYLALRHGEVAFCFNSFGVGTGMRGTIDSVSLPLNAHNVYHFDVEGRVPLIKRIADFFDLPITVLLFWCTPANFGHRFKIKPRGSESMADAIRDAVAETARLQKERNGTQPRLLAEDDPDSTESAPAERVPLLS